MKRKPRIDGDGPSPEQRLRDLSPEEHEFFQAQAGEISAKRLIAQIESRHGIYGLTEQALSRFWRWLDSQRALRQMNADAEQFRKEFAQEGLPVTAEEIHIRTVDYMRLKGVREDNDKLLAYAVTEARKAIELEHGARKLALLEKKAEAAKEVLTDQKLSPEEQTAKMREVFGL